MTTSEIQIAEDLLAYLRDHPTVCADVSAQGYHRPWVRYRDGAYQLAGYGEISRIHATTLDEDQAISLFKHHPVQLLPASKAYRWKPATKTVWDDGAEQDAFTRSRAAGGAATASEQLIYLSTKPSRTATVGYVQTVTTRGTTKTN